MARLQLEHLVKQYGRADEPAVHDLSLDVEDGEFVCLWHNWRYSCKDGSCLSHSGLPLRQYTLKIVDDKIYIDLLG